MGRAGQPENIDDEQIGNVLAEYLSMVSAGENVDRDEFIAQYPSLSSQLRSYFEWAEMMDQFTLDGDTAVGDSVRGTHRALLDSIRSLSAADRLAAESAADDEPEGFSDDITASSMALFINGKPGGEQASDEQQETMLGSIDLSEEFTAEEEEFARKSSTGKSTDGMRNSGSGLGSVAGLLKDSDPGRILNDADRYRIIKKLGAGMMGNVYLAEDTQLDRRVALKTPKITETEDPAFIKRFYREARSAARISHPNICQVYDVGEHGGVHYISMAYIDGHQLTDFIDPDKPLPERDIVKIVRKLALALAEAHQNGIVHRDLKPANIMVDHRGEPIIMDFGLARQTKQDADMRVTKTGQVMGTPAYMSPEQVEGDTRKIGPASDVFALGVILYEMLTGELPFTGSLTTVLKNIVSAPPPRPSAKRPDVDRALEEICVKMMAKRVQNRYASMQQVADACAALLGESAEDTSWGKLSGIIVKASPHDSILQSNAELKQSVSDVESVLNSEVMDEPVPPQTPADPEIVEQLDRQKQEVADLVAEHDYDQALEVLQQMQETTDPLASVHVEWAKKETVRVKALPEKYQQQSRAALRTALQLIHNHDYQQAIKLLDQIPDQYRSDECNDVLDQAIGMQDEVDLLVADMENALKRQEYDGLRSHLKRLLELKPGHRQARQVLKQLDEGLLQSANADSSKGATVRRIAIGAGFVGITLLLGGLYFFSEDQPAQGTLAVQLPPVSGCVVTIDDQTYSAHELATPIVLEAGTHKLRVTRDGTVLEEVDVSIIEGTHKALQMLGGAKIFEETSSEDMAVAATETASTETPAAEASPAPSARKDTARVLAGHLTPVAHIAFSVDGKCIFTSEEDQRALIVWDAETGKQLRRIEGYGTAVGSGDAAGLFAANSLGTIGYWQNTIGAADGGANPSRRYDGHLGKVPALAVSPDGQFLLSGGSDFSVRLWKADTGEQLRQLSGHQQSVQAVAFSNDGQLLFSFGADRTICLWNAGNGELSGTFQHPEASAAALSADAQFYAVGRENGAIFLHRATDGAVQRELTGMEHEIRQLAFSPNGMRLAAAGAEGAVCVWDLYTGRLLKTFTSHTSAVNAVAFSPDSHFLVSGSDDLTARVWLVSTLEELQGPPLTPINAAIRWVLSRRGELEVVVGGETRLIGSLNELPTEPFAVHSVQLNDLDAVEPGELQHLAAFPEIRYLNLARSQIAAQELAVVSRLPALTVLRLDGTPVRDEVVPLLKGATGLKVLHLQQTAISEIATAMLAKALPNCRINRDPVELASASEAERTMAVAALTAGGRLEVATPEGRRVVTDAENLPAALALLSLDLSGKEIDGEAFAQFSAATNLRFLSLAGVPLGDERAASLADLQKLEVLRLPQTGLTDAGLAHLESLKELRWLDLRGNVLGETTIQTLRQKLPECRIEF